MTHRPVVALTDCADANAQARQAARIAALFGSTPDILPLSGPDPEGVAALTLLDLLRSVDLTGGPTHPLVVLVNIAPRDGHWPNGAPFCWFEYRGHLVVSSWNQRVLAPLAAHLGVTEVRLTDVREVVEAAAGQWAEFTAEQVEEIVRTQFRSLWYVPLLAHWLVAGHPVPGHPQALAAPPRAEQESPRIAVIDNFGNCKLDVPAAELPGYAEGGTIAVRSRRDDRTVPVRCYDRLPDVPYGEPGFTTGSSGVGFAELVVRGGSAAELFALRQGDRVLSRG
ncbi:MULTISPECIES: SAM hydroxide adenosyltransferase [Kitasatospora]|uniref:S-adenosyl-l-methionine hydroxide adenosyltransferase C-terminal domain-containing protein n=1 Tax=Kitasatospora setae (strain ATCC 33774 / DSM 43861 / JCM 3304 / KCC A-0304 / NBRC 14216 / KM-6054) TaxID=452652 RepID=E4N7D4_KITSK|nr:MULTISPECIES: SAM hydroxide adenosyltransferase [Kitasatospora]BAJ27115.1 hypothetical protein KSE_12840 [Kitasatospora setae KM-6054]